MVVAVSTLSWIALAVALPVVLAGVVLLFRSTPSGEERGGVPGRDGLIDYGGTSGGGDGGSGGT